MTWHHGGRTYGYRSRPSTLAGWIRENRSVIDDAINRELREPSARRNDDERRLWVLNFEPLYLAARAAGVKV